MPAWVRDIFMDAAGGSLEAPGRGSGGILGSQWYYAGWSGKVNGGKWKVDGKKVGRKLSALELMGPLIALVLFAEECQGQPVNIWVDNAGSVRIWQKGYSSWCRLSTTVVKAISTAAAALGCRVEIRKVRRCTGTGRVLANQLSKAQFREFRETAGWAVDAALRRVTGALLRWLARPVPWDDLGHELLAELGEWLELPGYSCQFIE